MSLTTDRSPQPPSGPPWGVGATLAWTLTAFAVSMLIATLVFGLWSAGRPRPVSSAYDGVVIAIVVIAPIGEEIAFRGFLFRGWAKPGWEMYAVAGIALAWALLHIQYDWLGMVQIFVAGLVLGWFRWATGSTILTIGMHILVNSQSMLETWIKMEFFP